MSVAFEISAKNTFSSYSGFFLCSYRPMRACLKTAIFTALEEPGARHSKVSEKLYFHVWVGNESSHNSVLAGVN